MCISLDIVYGEDLANHHTLHWWCLQIRRGAVAGVVAGPPCESWSVARHMHDQDGGARPIRCSATPWGLDGLPNRLLEQNILANTFMLATMLIMVECAFAWVPAIMEHPAYTELHRRESVAYGRPASVWKTDQMYAILGIGRRGPGVPDETWTRLTTIHQGDHGCDGVKPTTFLLVALPQFEQVHARMRCHTTSRMFQHMIGMEERDGRRVYRTARAKEYPSPLCAMMATALIEANYQRDVGGAHQCVRDVTELSCARRLLERAAGDVQMGADYAAGSAGDTWRPVGPVEDHEWMPPYPLCCYDEALADPPSAVHWQYQ